MRCVGAWHGGGGRTDSHGIPRSIELDGRVIIFAIVTDTPHGEARVIVSAAVIDLDRVIILIVVVVVVLVVVVVESEDLRCGRAVVRGGRGHPGG
jgi:hypothetical protein